MRLFQMDTTRTSRSSRSNGRVALQFLKLRDELRMLRGEAAASFSSCVTGGARTPTAA